jgi:hypothetical protein
LRGPSKCGIGENRDNNNHRRAVAAVAPLWRAKSALWRVEKAGLPRRSDAKAGGTQRIAKTGREKFFEIFVFYAVKSLCPSTINLGLRTRTAEFRCPSRIMGKSVSGR